MLSARRAFGDIELENVNRRQISLRLDRRSHRLNRLGDNRRGSGRGIEIEREYRLSNGLVGRRDRSERGPGNDLGHDHGCDARRIATSRDRRDSERRGRRSRLMGLSRHERGHGRRRFGNERRRFFNIVERQCFHERFDLRLCWKDFRGQYGSARRLIDEPLHDDFRRDHFRRQDRFRFDDLGRHRGAVRDPRRRDLLLQRQNAADALEVQPEAAVLHALKLRHELSTHMFP